jgi:hypothetical protein
MEAFPDLTPYQYSFNNPLGWHDPTGLAPEKEKRKDRVMSWAVDVFSASAGSYNYIMLALGSGIFGGGNNFESLEEMKAYADAIFFGSWCYDKNSPIGEYVKGGDRTGSVTSTNGLTVTNVGQINFSQWLILAQAYPMYKAALNLMIFELSEITGLKLTINNETGNLQCIGFNEDEDGNIKGSKTARDFLVSLLNNPDVNIPIELNLMINSCYDPTNKGIAINPKQISEFIYSTPEMLNPMTMGFGIFLLHELQHAEFNLKSENQVVDFENQVRREMGPDWGKRLRYDGFPYKRLSPTSHDCFLEFFRDGSYIDFILPCEFFKKK